MTGNDAVAALPTSVRIGPFDFAIVIASTLESTGRGEWGSCSSIAQKINIQADMPSAIKAVDTFLHEVCHAIYSTWHIYDDDKEERTVAILGRALATLHRDNPWLADWLKASLA